MVLEWKNLNSEVCLQSRNKKGDTPGEMTHKCTSKYRHYLLSTEFRLLTGIFFRTSKEIGSNTSKRMDLPVRLRPGRQRARASLFRSFMQAAARFQVNLPTLNDPDVRLSSHIKCLIKNTPSQVKE